MTNIFSKCIICGQFFNSKKNIRKHKDKNHRISKSKMMAGGVEDLTRTISNPKALPTRE
ncbi:MAG: hypothetical protein M3M87_02175 [Thermoproteota archaeon]|nr:hypothetical protein [Thermoproteota archaeon]